MDKGERGEKGCPGPMQAPTQVTTLLLPPNMNSKLYDAFRYDRHSQSTSINF